MDGVCWVCVCVCLRCFLEIHFAMRPNTPLGRADHRSENVNWKHLYTSISLLRAYADTEKRICYQVNISTSISSASLFRTACFRETFLLLLQQIIIIVIPTYLLFYWFYLLSVYFQASFVRSSNNRNKAARLTLNIGKSTAIQNTYTIVLKINGNGNKNISGKRHRNFIERQR